VTVLQYHLQVSRVIGARAHRFLAFRVVSSYGVVKEKVFIIILNLVVIHPKPPPNKQSSLSVESLLSIQERLNPL
jgi:hypothetical protein